MLGGKGKRNGDEMEKKAGPIRVFLNNLKQVSGDAVIE